MSATSKDSPTLDIFKSSSESSDTRSIHKKISGRQSKELVIAFSGPIGSGIGTTINKFETALKKAGYKIVMIKVSDIIKDTIELLQKTPSHKLQEPLKDKDLSGLKGKQRYELLQTAGNHLRETLECDILAQKVISKILTKRMNAARPEFDKKLSENTIPSDLELISYAVEHYVPEKTAYLVDQLKHHSEVELLRYVYDDLFYLIGNLSIEDERKKNLKSEGISAPDAAWLMDRDRKESDDHGQQIDKTLKLSDYFIRVSHADNADLDKQIKRFINLIHRNVLITPNKHEYGMYIAYSAGLKSACLSRQVGACIVDKDGQVISTGCNDVPKFDGGLYTTDSVKDLRCYNKGGICYNDDYKKRELSDKIRSILEKHNVKPIDKICDEIKSETRLKDLIEYSRSIHAEMDAITSLAKNGGPPTQSATLYTTVYPCHNCARHIIAAGIHQVVYIEPYEKSLAYDLHEDAISLETKQKGKVTFIHFFGVSPRRYQDFFLSNDERKKQGKYIERDDYSLKQKIHPLLDSYRLLETKVYEHLSSEGLPVDKSP